jgi:hypothetical protein
LFVPAPAKIGSRSSACDSLVLFPLAAADIVLLAGIEALPTALARRSLRTIRENLFWAFVYNLIGLPLAACPAQAENSGKQPQSMCRERREVAIEREQRRARSDCGRADNGVPSAQPGMRGE